MVIFNKCFRQDVNQAEEEETRSVTRGDTISVTRDEASRGGARGGPGGTKAKGGKQQCIGRSGGRHRDTLYFEQ